MTRLKAFLPLIALVLFLMVPPVLAGGWSVTTLDDLPEHAIAGEPVPVGFVVRQHGVRVLSGLTPVISAVHEQSGDTVEFGATEDTPGHYLAELVFPREGTWSWSVNAFGPVQPLPPLAVLPAGTALATPGEEGEALSDWGALVERGAALYVAKGCVVCHQHAKVSVQAFASINRGPDLTDFGASADYLSVWLANPAAVKPSTVMPALGLDEAEIEALIAFLNAEETQAARAERLAGLLRSLRW
jgi:mono/diheme cytochrome c family protein